MAKQLVERGNVEQFICHAEKKLYVGQTIILTPGAKDYLREKGIAVVYAEQPAQPAVKTTPVPSPEAVAVTSLDGRIQQLLKNDFAITDSNLITEVTRKVMAKLENPQ